MYHGSALNICVIRIFAWRERKKEEEDAKWIQKTIFYYYYNFMYDGSALNIFVIWHHIYESLINFGASGDSIPLVEASQVTTQHTKAY